MNKKVLALGFFDSIHIGHRYLLNEAQKEAEKRQDNVLVATFDDNFLSLVFSTFLKISFEQKTVPSANSTEQKAKTIPLLSIEYKTERFPSSSSVASYLTQSLFDAYFTPSLT